MAKLPGAESISGPASLRPNAPAQVADVSGIARGISNLAGSVGAIAENEMQKMDTIDFARADAYQTKAFLNMQNKFQQDGDYATIADRAEKESQETLGAAANLIRNPRARQQWLEASEKSRIVNVDAISDIGTVKANQAERVALDGALEEYSRLITEPGTPDPIRESARRSLAATIDVAEQTGLYDPLQAEEKRSAFIDVAEEQLALNRLDALTRADPDAALGALGIGPTGDPLDDARNAVRLPVVTAPGTDLASIDPAILNRFEQVQSVFGTQLPVISGERSEARNKEVGGADQSRHVETNGGDAIDIDVSKLSKDERVRLIETASAMGFNGIGVYNNSLHLDTRSSRQAWGPSYSDDSTVPAWAREALDRHKSGAIAEVPVGAARDVDPRFAALTYQQRAAGFDRAKQASEQRDMQMRVGIETTAENAPAAIARQGEYDGNLPTANDFVQAYGAADGIQRYEAFDASVKVAQDTFAMRTMTADEIAALVDRAVPTSTGDDAALQEAKFEQISKAADATIKAREEDPSSYVTQVYPAVGQAWDAVDDDPSKFAQAVTVTAMAQEQLGITNMQLIPKTMAANTAAAFNNDQTTDAERMGALTGVVMATSNPDHQAAIYNQLVAEGVPPETRPAMDALARGDDGAAQRLFRAAMVKGDDLKALPGDVKPAQVDNEIAAQVFDDGQIGDVAYDLTYGATSNLNDAIQDRAVMANSVKLRLLDGSASNLQDAIDQTVKDMFGDVEVVTGASYGGKAGMKVLLPTGTDANTYQAGFDSLLGEVGEALAADLEQDLGTVSADNAQRAIAQSAVANYVEQTLSGGYFTNAGDGVFKFIDPNGRGAVLGRDGQPLTFTAAQVSAAGADADTPMVDPEVGASWSVDADGNYVLSEGAR